MSKCVMIIMISKLKKLMSKNPLHSISTVKNLLLPVNKIKNKMKKRQRKIKMKMIKMIHVPIV